MANIPVFIPHMGCKNDCVFCNQRQITGSLMPPDEAECRRIIEENLKTLQGDEHTVAFFGGSFTGIGNDKMEAYLKIAYEYVKTGRVKGIRLSTRPDYIDEEILDILKRYSVTNIELGAQSLDDEALKAANRGHTREDVEKAARLINNYGFTLGLQMMVGLPGDTAEKSIMTATEFVKMGAKETRIYPTVVIRGTKLEEMLENGEYVPMSFDEAIDASARCYSIFFENGVKVLRIGLQNSPELKESAVGGYYHDAIGELVYSQVIRQKVSDNSHIKYNGRFLSKVLGQKKSNEKYFAEKGIRYTMQEDDTLTGVMVDGKYVLTI